MKETPEDMDFTGSDLKGLLFFILTKRIGECIPVPSQAGQSLMIYR